MSAVGPAPVSGREPRVVLVDDDALIRTLLGRILGAHGMAVVGEAEDGDGVVDVVLSRRPDVVLMDLRMVRVDGIEATGRVRAIPNPPGIIALTSFDTEAAILDAVAAGVAGFLAKDSAPEEIVTAVRQVAAGEGALSPRAARVVMQQMHGSGRTADRRKAERALAGLTARERDVAQGVVEGLSNAELAARLYVSEATVKTHLTAAMGKAGVENRVQLAVLVARALDAARE